MGQQGSSSVCAFMDVHVDTCVGVVVLFVWCSYEGRMVMCPIVCPASATVGISLRNRKGGRRNALTRGEDRGH